jgi:endonuclease IV
MNKKARFIAVNQVHFTAEQFKFLKPGHFEEALKRIAEATGIPIICSCGRGIVSEADAREIESLLREASQGNEAVKEIFERLSHEEYYINLAASEHIHSVDSSEATLRKL